MFWHVFLDIQQTTEKKKVGNSKKTMHEKKSMPEGTKSVYCYILKLPMKIFFQKAQHFFKPICPKNQWNQCLQKPWVLYSRLREQSYRDQVIPWCNEVYILDN